MMASLGHSRERGVSTSTVFDEHADVAAVLATFRYQPSSVRGERIGVGL